MDGKFLGYTQDGTAVWDDGDGYWLDDGYSPGYVDRKPVIAYR